MDILTHRHGAVLAIEFNRPLKKNAFTSDMMETWLAALETCRTSSTFASS